MDRTETASTQKLGVMKCVTFQKKKYLSVDPFIELESKFLTHESVCILTLERMFDALAGHEVFRTDY